MSKRRKSFTGGKSITDFEPIEFDLNGKAFHCKPAIQGAVLLEFVAKADGESGGEAAGALYGFFQDCMEAEQYAAFRAELNRDDFIIDMETIGKIASWLVEEYTARPTEQSAPSGSGQSSAGQTSTDQLSSVG